ncbi:NifB/NifX family molybdenum-iron cluster-binding protein [Anaeromyxobacter sp. PSR-1]|uniref:NifB/NifX family molybdenum-iron cluster-binding protein n=1 Tax=Anaeromyxobacter sp. PSR-1 TaxID=1300915 RepID=UPI0005E3718A|nr:NifB/NifX family molybdenum-iron cluster-binding protein [Anaeromyxobacter sp. PSR-1]GAO02067.1 protein NifX [Anaeromyxobacter sp. PSR-1]
MRVAFTSSNGSVIDQHFGQCGRFWIWEVGPATAAPIGEVEALAAGDEDDRTTARAAAVAGCAIVFTRQIGGPAAAKLAARRIHPMKLQADVPIAEAVTRLQEVLRGTPPPWLRRLLAQDEATDETDARRGG